MENLVAKKSLRYGGRSLEPGDKFQAGPRHARVLKAIGKASDGRAGSSVPADPQHALTQPADVVAGASALDHDGDGRPGGSRKASANGGRYNRRDMQVED